MTEEQTEEQTEEAEEVVNAPHGGPDENSVDIPEVETTDGLGELGKKTPPEFASDAQYERHLEDLERELAGRQRRLAELEASGGASQIVIDEVNSEIEAVTAELARLAPKAKATRPRAASETRAK